MSFFLFQYGYPEYGYGDPQVDVGEALRPAKEGPQPAAGHEGGAHRGARRQPREAGNTARKSPRIGLVFVFLK